MEILTKEEFYDKKLINSKRKFCYELCKSVNFKRSEIAKYAEMYGCEPTTIYLNAKKYALEELNMSPEQFAKETGLKGTIYIDAIEKLLKAKNIEEIKEILNVDGLNLTFLLERVKEYPRIHRKELTTQQQDQMTAFLKKRVNIVLEEQRKLRQQEQLAKRQQEIRESDIKEFKLFRELIANSKISERDLKRELSTKRYERILKLLEVEEQATYKMYMRALKYRKIASEKVEELLKEKLLKLLAYITNGIEEDGKIKKFDMLDCYEIFKGYTNYLYGKVKLFEGVLPAESRVKIQQFLSHTIDAELKSNEISDLLNEKCEFDCEKDEKGNNIKGTGIAITREEKENWLIYLKENNIPVTYHNLSLLKEKTKNALREEKANEKKKCNI